MIVSSINNGQIEVKIIMTEDELETLRLYSLTPSVHDPIQHTVTFDLNKHFDSNYDVPVGYMEAIENLTKAFQESSK